MGSMTPKATVGGPFVPLRFNAILHPSSREPLRTVRPKIHAPGAVRLSGGEVHVATDSKAVEELPLPEGDCGLPFVGRTLEYLTEGSNFHERQYTRHGEVSKTHLFGRPTAYIYGADVIQQILALGNDVVDTYMIPSMEKLVGPKENSFFGPDHGIVKKLLSPNFTSSFCRSCADQISKTMDPYIKRWETMDSFLYIDEIRACTFSVMAEVAMGWEFPFGGLSKEEMMGEFEVFADGLISLGLNLPFTKFGKALAAKETLKTAFNKQIDYIKQNPAVDRPEGLCALVKARRADGTSLTREHIVCIVLGVLFAGYETTASTQTVTMLRLGKHPEVWRKVQEEQRRIVETFGPAFSGEALDAMEYTDAVVSEGLRTLPVSLSTIRILKKDLEINGQRLPKGWVVHCFGGYSDTYLDDRWPMDDGFCPERHLTEAGRNKRPSLVFGWGSHTCLGQFLARMEFKVIIAKLARDYDFTVLNPDPEMVHFPIVHPKDRMPVKIRRHNGRQ